MACCKVITLFRKAHALLSLKELTPQGKIKVVRTGITWHNVTPIIGMSLSMSGNPFKSDKWILIKTFPVTHKINHLNCSANIKSTMVTGQQQLLTKIAYRIILRMRPANERWRYSVTSSLIAWVHTQNDPEHTNQHTQGWAVPLQFHEIKYHKSHTCFYPTLLFIIE